MSYLPYILKDIVAKVDTVFSSRATDTFNVFFDYGLYVDVSKNIYKKTNEGYGQDGLYPLVWLVDDWDIKRGDDSGYYGEVSFQLIIAMPTSNEYTAEQRSELVFLPRLLPIYEELLKQISKNSSFSVINHLRISHTVRKRSYWGGSEGGSDTKNLFGDYVDALHIPSMSLILNETIVC